MAWTVIIEDEHGYPIRTMPDALVLSNEDEMFNERFRLIKYIDQYGDTTFNGCMFEDLIKDLIELKSKLPSDTEQIDNVISYVEECKEGSHTYLKFYGD